MISWRIFFSLSCLLRLTGVLLSGRSPGRHKHFLPSYVKAQDTKSATQFRAFLLFCRLERLVWHSFRHCHTYCKFMYSVIMLRTKWAVNTVKLNIARSISSNFLTRSLMNDNNFHFMSCNQYWNQRIMN